MTTSRRMERISLSRIMQRIDGQEPGDAADDTVRTGFPSIDKVLGGGIRSRDLVVLGGDVGAGKSALTLGIALRSAEAGFSVAYFSGEMDEDRLFERAIAIEGRIQIDELRSAQLTEAQRWAMGAVALRLQDLPLTVYPLVGRRFDEALEAAWPAQPQLVVIDYLQLMPAPADRLTQEEDAAAALRALKALALERQVALLVVAQLPKHAPNRPDPRPTLDDFGTLGSIKQHADVILGLYREEMYNPGGGVEGATELIVAKNRNGPTGFVDLYFYNQWMRFEDMLDPDR